MMVLPVETTLPTLLVLLIATLDGLGFIVKESVAFGPKSSRKGGVTCEYGGKLYPPGDFRLSSNVTCKCIEQTGELRCVSETCEHRAGCLEYDPSTPARCCTDSVEYGCVYNGTGYPRGANIPAGPCTRCYCPWEVGGPSRKPFCIDFHCPKVQCVDAIVPRGHCCPICPNGPNCWLEDLMIPAGQDVWVDKCRSCYCPEEPEEKTEKMMTSSSPGSRKGQGQERRAVCYRHSGCIEW